MASTALDWGLRSACCGLRFVGRSRGSTHTKSSTAAYLQAHHKCALLLQNAVKVFVPRLFPEPKKMEQNIADFVHGKGASSVGAVLPRAPTSHRSALIFLQAPS